jgi:hypothetical protein
VECAASLLALLHCWRSERADDGENTLNGLVEKVDATSAPSLLLQRKLHLFCFGIDLRGLRDNRRQSFTIKVSCLRLI